MTDELRKNIKIKILFVIGSFKLGGAERQMVYFIKHVNRLHFKPFVCFFHADGPLINEIPDDFVKINFSGKVKGKISKLIYLTKLIFILNPDVVYSNLAGTNLPLGFVRIFSSIMKRKTRYVISVVNNIDFFSNSIFKYVVRKFYARMDLIFACASGMYDQLRDKFGIPEHKLSIMYNGVDIDFIEKRSSEPVSHSWLDSDMPCLITVASFLPQKKLDDLIKVFEKVNREISCYLLIVGDGDLRSEIETLAVSLGVKDRIDFLGYQYNSNKYVSRADIFVSTSSFEGMALVLLEAAIVGTPIVCTDAPFGSRDVVKDETMGVIVGVGDLESLTDGILRMLRDKEHAKMVSANAKEHVKTNFDLKTIVKKFEDRIRSII